MKIMVSIICLVSSLYVKSQMLYPSVGSYDGKSAQGMAIWDDQAYLFNYGGHCRILNLKTCDIVGSFLLASANKSNHVNNACFGSDVYNLDNKPVIYI